ncbi:hypothetical protein JKP88DRAFT_306942, partial [Tribonema minus]
SLCAVLLPPQLVAGFLEVTGLQLAPAFENFIHKLATLLNLSFAWGCVYNATFYEQLLVMTLGPLVAVALLGCSWLWALVREHRVQRVAGADAARAVRLKALRKHWTAFLALTFLVYGTVSSTIFQTFACDYVQELDTYYLRADYSIQCYNNLEYWRYFAYAMTMFVVYPLGVPALYALLLCSRRRQQHQAQQGLVAAAPNSHWDLVHASSFLWAQYKPEAEWWEIVECARRVVLTGVLVFILPGSAGQAAVSVLFAFFLALMFMAVRPYREHTMQRQYLLGAVIVYFASMNALLIKSQVSDDQATGCRGRCHDSHQQCTHCGSSGADTVWCCRPCQKCARQ